MARVHELSRTDARRIAVRAQLLTRQRPTGLVATVRQLTLVQIEPTNAVAPSAELVLWSRLGSAFDPQEMWDALDEQQLIELHQTLRVPEDIALFRAEMAAWPGSGELREWQEDVGSKVDDTASMLKSSGEDVLNKVKSSGGICWTTSAFGNMIFETRWMNGRRRLRRN